MAENEGMEGKNLAVKEKIENVVGKIKRGENIEQEELMIVVKGVGIPLTIEKDEKEASHKINILGVHILTLEDEELSFTEGWEDELSAKTEGIIDAQDLINELKEILDRQKEEQQREGTEGEERGESHEKGEENPKTEKPEEKEKQYGDEEQQLANKKFPKKDSSWIEIKSDRETDEMRTFSTMLKKEYRKHMQGAERFFIAPNPKDPNDYKLYVADRQGNVINQIPLEPTEGKNPMDEDILAHGKKGNDVKTKQAVQILKIGNSVNGAMLVITGGTKTGTQVHIGNRSRGDDYNVHQISSSLSQNEIMDASDFVRRGTSSAYGEREEGSREKKYFEVLKKLEKQGVPEESNPAKDGISAEEIEVNSLDNLTASIAAIFAKEYGLSRQCAMSVATGVVEEGKNFEEALEEGILEELDEQDKNSMPGATKYLAKKLTDKILAGDTEGEDIDNDQKTPDENPRRRDH